MARAYEDAQARLRLPGNAWAAQAVGLYLDSKDHLRLRPEDLTEWGAACLRAVRVGSGGLLGNPPML